MTDVISAASMYTILATLKEYKDYYFIFYLLFGFDLGSHWLQVCSTFLKGNSTHKGEDDDELYIVKLYYNSYTILACLWLLAEYFLLSLYSRNFESLPTCVLFEGGGRCGTSFLLEKYSILRIIFIASWVGFVIKQIVHLAQIYSSVLRLLSLDSVNTHSKIK